MCMPPPVAVTSLNSFPYLTGVVKHSGDALCILMDLCVI